MNDINTKAAGATTGQYHPRYRMGNAGLERAHPPATAGGTDIMLWSKCPKSSDKLQFVDFGSNEIVARPSVVTFVNVTAWIYNSALNSYMLTRPGRNGVIAPVQISTRTTRASTS